MSGAPVEFLGREAQAGNKRSVRHGARSEQAIIPVREERARELRERYPDLDDLRLALLADRLARIQVASAWLDAKGTVVRDRNGRVYDVADRIEKWSSKAERILAELAAERASRGPRDITAQLAEVEDDG